MTRRASGSVSHGAELELERCEREQRAISSARGSSKVQSGKNGPIPELIGS